MANYQRIISAGGGSSAADLAIVGTEQTVSKGLCALIDAGATDVWAQPVAVGDDRESRRTSLRRTLDLLRHLARD
jgi:hypothetical protein